MNVFEVNFVIYSKLVTTEITINYHHWSVMLQAQDQAHQLQGGSNMTGTDLCVNKPHYAAAVRP